MAIGNYGISRFQSAIQTSKLPPQDQQNPVYNNSNSAADNNYPYDAPLNKEQLLNQYLQALTALRHLEQYRR